MKHCRNCSFYYGDYKKGCCTIAPGLGTGQNVLGADWCKKFNLRLDGERRYTEPHDKEKAKPTASWLELLERQKG